MTNKVFANNNEVACKAASGKVICAFPDVCFTPPDKVPPTPIGVPVPYPNTGFASDTHKGSKKVKISNKEVALKNKSYFKKSTGDEAGAAQKKGVVTGKNKGKVYFQAWSMDVKIEGNNVARHLDLTTNNHGSFPGDTPTWPYLDTLSMSNPDHPCVESQIKEMLACSECKPYGNSDPCTNEDCKKARRCSLAPFDPPKKDLSKSQTCCPGETGHHVVPVQEFSLPGKPRGRALNEAVEKYNQDLAPCICVEGKDHKDYKDTPPYQLKEHGLIGSAYVDARLEMGIKNNQMNIKYCDLRDCGIKSILKFHDCDEKCLKAQLDNYHVKQCEIPEADPVCRASQQSKYDEYQDSPVRSE